MSSALSRNSLVALATCLLGFVALQYFMPFELPSMWTINARGAEHYRDAIGAPRDAVLPHGTFSALFSAAVLVAYAAFAMLLFSTARAPKSDGQSDRRIIGIAAPVLALAVALACPPALSNDVYAYLAYARMHLIYDLNPYLTSQADLIARGDPVGPFLSWDLPSPYGPIWTWLCIGLTWPMKNQTILAQITAFKLLAAAALQGAGWVGHRLAERLHPGRGVLVFTAITLNPLLLIEGPGNGHVDLILLLLLLGTALLFMQGRVARASLLLGLALASKITVAVVLPWILREEIARKGDRKILRMMWVLALAVVPLVLAYAPFWAGVSTFDGLRERDAQAGVEPIGRALLLVGYLVVCVWQFRAPQGRLHWLTGWAVMSLLLAKFAAGFLFPWYLVACVTLPFLHAGPRERFFGVLSLAVALVATLMYVYQPISNDRAGLEPSQTSPRVPQASQPGGSRAVFSFVQQARRASLTASHCKVSVTGSDQSSTAPRRPADARWFR